MGIQNFEIINCEFKLGEVWLMPNTAYIDQIAWVLWQLVSMF
jgi:hypothetical protein